MKNYLILTLFIFFPCHIFPQDKQVIDSLEKKLSSLAGKEKAQALDELCWQYSFTDLNKSLQAGRQALEIAREMNDTSLIAQCYNDIGIVFYRQSDFDSALVYYHRSLHLRKLLGVKPQIAATYSKIGIANTEMGNLKEAMENQMAALNIYEETGDSVKAAMALSNIGDILWQQRNTTEAKKYFERAYNISEKANHYYGMATSLGNLARYYYHEKEYPEAIELTRRALFLAEKVNDLVIVATAYSNLGSYFNESGETDTAYKYYEKAIIALQQINNNNTLAHTLLKMGKILSSRGKRMPALEKLWEGISVAEKYNIKPELRFGYRYISDLYSGSGRFDSAYFYHKKFSAVSDAILNEELSDQLVEIEKKYQAEKKQKEIVLLKKENEIQSLNLEQQNLIIQKRNNQILLTVGILILLIVSVILFLRYNKLKQEQERNRLVLETERKERIRIAKDMHDELGSGLSKIAIANNLAIKQKSGNPEIAKNLSNIEKATKDLVGNMNDLIWSLRPENATLEILVAKIREFAADFLEEANINFLLDFPEEVPSVYIFKEAQHNIFLTIKEALNNAIKHSEAKQVIIALNADNKMMSISIADNGNGFDLKKATASGNGLKNMQYRIEKTAGSFEIISNPGKGTEVKIFVPMEKITEILKC